MGFLRLLEPLRTPFWDSIMGFVTTFGEETVLMIAGMALLWCLDKKWGFRLLFIGLIGNTLNQLLKAVFLIPRPWVLDKNFTIVESAREAATGYSFPSGHTQTVTAVFGTIGLWQRKRKWVVICAAVAILLTGFSRMYLGVHTPLDVGVSLVTGMLTLLLLARLFDRLENNRRGKLIFGGCAAVFAVILLCYLYFAPVRDANVAEFDAHGLKSAWTLIGTMCGLMLAWWVDDKYTHFDTKAVWWAQILKLALGLGIIMAVRVGLKGLLAAVFGSRPFTDGIRYFIMATAGGVLWPLTFKFWGKLGRKTTNEKTV